MTGLVLLGLAVFFLIVIMFIHRYFGQSITSPSTSHTGLARFPLSLERSGRAAISWEEIPARAVMLAVVTGAGTEATAAMEAAVAINPGWRRSAA